MKNLKTKWLKRLFPFANKVDGISMVEVLVSVGVMGVSASLISGAMGNTQKFKASQEDRSRLDALRSYAMTALSCDNTLSKEGARDVCLTDGEHIISSYKGDNSELSSSSGSTMFGRYYMRAMCNKTGVYFQAKTNEDAAKWQDLGRGIPVFCPLSTPIGTPMKKFFVGAEDRPSDPDPYPYNDFDMCFYGDFTLDAKGIVHAVSAQTVTFQLFKYSGCTSYTWTTVIKSSDGKVKNQVARTMVGENASGNITVDVDAGDIISGVLQTDVMKPYHKGGCAKRTATLESRSFISLVSDGDFSKYAVPSAVCK